MKLYHGSYRKIDNADSNRGMYFTNDINIAKQYALGLDDCGNYNEESFIYEVEISDDVEITVMEDWMDFDQTGYYNYNNSPEFATCEEMEEYFFVKNPNLLTFKLIENYKNEL
jgi:hypothetical protein